MKYLTCNEKCKPKKGLHWLGDRMITEKALFRFYEEVKVCLLCGRMEVPYYGFAFPCVGSTSGFHQGQGKEETKSKVQA